MQIGRPGCIDGAVREMKGCGGPYGLGNAWCYYPQQGKY